MSTISNYLELHTKEILSVISILKNEFSSHDFIEKFAKRFESDYIDMLIDYKDTGKAFQTVHSQIAHFLSVNANLLGIVKLDRRESETVFGTIDVIQFWEKV